MLAQYSYAQTAEHQLRQTIDQTLWAPFKQAFESLNGDALNELYAESVLRVTPEGIDTRGAFKVSNRTRFDANRNNGETINLDFWFDSRRSNATHSYDVGFYRIRFTTKNGSTTDFYGQFHIVLRKINGRWKITQDWDTTAIGGREIGAEDFAKKPPYKF